MKKLGRPVLKGDLAQEGDIFSQTALIEKGGVGGLGDPPSPISYSSLEILLVARFSECLSFLWNVLLGERLEQ